MSKRKGIAASDVIFNLLIVRRVGVEGHSILWETKCLECGRVYNRSASNLRKRRGGCQHRFLAWVDRIAAYRLSHLEDAVRAQRPDNVHNGSPQGPSNSTGGTPAASPTPFDEMFGEPE